MVERILDKKILNLIIFCLFRDGNFHSLEEKSKKEFYIDILDEILADDVNDVEFEDYLNEFGKLSKLEDIAEKLFKIVDPYFERVKNVLVELKNNGWIDLDKQAIKIEVFEKGFIEKTRDKDLIIPAGRLLTHIFKISATEVNWGKFIEYISQMYEVRNLKKDEICSKNKQKFLIRREIQNQRENLDRDENIILKTGFLLGQGQVQILDTLKELENDEFIKINGVKIYNPEDRNDIIPEYFGLKFDISITNKFRDTAEEVRDEVKKITEEIIVKMNRETEKKKIGKTLFDINKSIFFINNSEIKIQKFSDQYHFLRIIFEDEDLKKEWFFSEIAERYDLAGAASISDKKFYNAAYQIDQKIIRDADIRDFFLKRTAQSFQINPKYFS